MKHGQEPGYHHSFGNAETWAKEFVDPARDAWQKPDDVLDALQLAPTAVVADIGAGTGYFSARIAKRVPDESVDVVLIVDTYHHIDDRIAYFSRLKSSLRPGGRLAIVDFKTEAPEGPPAKRRIPPEKVTGELEQAGYALVARQDFLPRQYFLVFQAQ
jgi:predicted methyltransferase